MKQYKIIQTHTTIGLIIGMFILVTLFNSCESDKKDVLCNPKPAYRIEIIDKDSINILGLNKQYNPDSIYYEINFIKIKANISSEYIYLPVQFDTLNDTDFYIVLSSSDKDTLRLSIENGNSECGKYTEILEFYYNDKLINEKSRIYKIIK